MFLNECEVCIGKLLVKFFFSVVSFRHWVIPENMLPYDSWHLGIPRERGVSWTGILKAWGLMQFGILNTWGGLRSEFPEGEGGKSSIASLEIADLYFFWL